MYIYEIEFSIPEKIELPEDIELPDDIDRDNLRQYVPHTIHLGGDNFFDVQEEAVDLIEESFYQDIPAEEMDYEITGIRQLDGIDILNWPETEDPLVKATHMADEDVMLVECPQCKQVIRIAEDGWDWVVCKKCGTKIFKDELLKFGRNWVVVKIGKDDPK